MSQNIASKKCRKAGIIKEGKTFKSGEVNLKGGSDPLGNCDITFHALRKNWSGIFCLCTSCPVLKYGRSKYQDLGQADQIFKSTQQYKP